MFNTPDFHRGKPVSAGKLNELSDLTNRLLTSRLSGSSALGSFGLLAADRLPESIWVKVTDNDGGTPPAHSWVEIIETEATVYEEKADGLYGDKVNLPLYEINGDLLPNGRTVRAWRGQGDYYLTACCGELSWLQVTSSTPQTIYLGRPILDGFIVSGSSTLTSDTAGFTSEDVGKTILGTGIPTGTTIASVQSTQSCTLSASVTSTVEEVPLILKGGQLSGYPAQLATLDLDSGLWTLVSGNVWFVDVNADTPVPGRRYQVRRLGEDYNGEPIWGSVDSFIAKVAVILSQTSQSVNLYNGSGGVAFTAYPAIVVPASNDGSYPNSRTTPQNAWLVIDGLGGAPFLNYLYDAYSIGVDSSSQLPIYMTDLQGPYGSIQTPAAFLDHPSEAAIQLAGAIQNPVNTFDGVVPIVLGSSYLVFGSLPGTIGSAPVTFPSTPAVYISAGTGGSVTAYKCDTGTDAAGSQFVSGLCVTVGTGGSGGSSGPIDGGSDW